MTGFIILVIHIIFGKLKSLVCRVSAECCQDFIDAVVFLLPNTLGICFMVVS